MIDYQPLLEQLKLHSRYRQRRVKPVQPANDAVPLINFSSNDYLNLSQHPKLIDALAQGAKSYGVGSSGSPLISGYTQAHFDLEQAFAQFLQRDAAIYFSSGYSANLAICKALAQSHHAVFSDKLCHASLIDGCMLAGLKLKRYRHNDMEHLQRLLSSQDQSSMPLLITEGVFSMDGDCADFTNLIPMARQYHCLLIADDSHGIGILGQHGLGSLDTFNVTQEAIPLLSFSLGKAFGGSGAIVAGKQELIDLMIQFGRSYIYSTAASPAMAFAMQKSLELVQCADERRQHLFDLIAHFHHYARQLNLPIDSMNKTPIQIMQIGDAATTIKISDALLNTGFLTGAIRPPTVPKHTSRLRITLNYQHNKTDIEQLLYQLKQIVLRCPETI